MKYNGWKNKATWLVNHHFGEALAEYSNYIEREIRTSEAESFVCEYLENEGAFNQSNPACELLSVALDQVDWLEIAIAASE